MDSTPVSVGAGIAEEVRRLTWYHTIDLPGGVTTPGEYDTRRALAKIPFPDSTSSQRCLDVGTHDGFWAFELERRGASEVIGIDLDDPRQVDFSEPGPVWTEEALHDRGARPLAFACAHAALGSSVKRLDLSVYDLPAAGLGDFDFAFLGTLLLHLRDPIRALTAIRDVLRPGGRLLINDPVSLSLSLAHPWRALAEPLLLPGKPFWWVPNARGLSRYVEKAGFRLIDSGRPYFIPRGPGYARTPPAVRNPVRRALHHRGMVHSWVLGERE